MNNGTVLCDVVQILVVFMTGQVFLDFWHLVAGCYRQVGALFS